MNKNSNAYVVLYTVILTAVCAVILAVAAEGLKPFRESNEKLELKKNILSTVIDIEGKSREDIEKLYETRVKNEYVIDAEGKELGKGIQATEKVNVGEQYADREIDKRDLPVYEVWSEDGTTIDAYVLPVYGFGLWDVIWGYVAVDAKDMNTVKGAVFAQKGETPGLGARITDRDIEDRFKGKQLFNEEGSFESVSMMKGEIGNAAYEKQPHQVDGMSGATITGQGLNVMMTEYLGGGYKTFLTKKDK